MRNRAIVANGLQRGGTNLLWNVLQSHPALCSPMFETGVLVTEKIAPFCWLPAAHAKRMACTPWVRGLFSGVLRRRFDDFKLQNYRSPINGARCEGIDYTVEEVRETAICLKGVDSDLDLNPLIEAMYGEVAHVPVVRDGYAVCNGWMRRGMSAAMAGRRYAKIVRRLLDLQQRPNACRVVRFEELVADPFGAAASLYTQLRLVPASLPKLRLKAKKVLASSGSHETSFGVEGQKYWLDPVEIRKVLRPDVDLLQKQRLSAEARRDFERSAAPVLEELGYL